ncbi:hypothetical protein [Sporisorium scitamineum]|uniref:Uncharacterized protein n=1 Tax=Sporisorium scitamineum TaxID=49012 RepID=A0A0F7S4B9_9BASI|nr:hypothetical protein [Sporisorium scitamineum]
MTCMGMSRFTEEDNRLPSTYLSKPRSAVLDVEGG